MQKQLAVPLSKLDVPSKTYGTFYYGHLSHEVQHVIEEWGTTGMLEHMADTLDVEDLERALPHFYRELKIAAELFRWIEETFYG